MWATLVPRSLYASWVADCRLYANGKAPGLPESPPPLNDNPARGHSRRCPRQGTEAACRAGSKFERYCSGNLSLVPRDV